MFKNLKHLLNDRLRQHGLTDAVEAAQVTEVFKDEVVRRFGPSAKGAFRKVALQGDTLEVSLTSTALASELRLAEFDLEDAMQARLRGKHYRLRIFG